MRWDFWNEYEFALVIDERKQIKADYKCRQCGRIKHSEIFLLVEDPLDAIIMTYCSSRCLRKAALEVLAK